MPSRTRETTTWPGSSLATSDGQGTRRIMDSDFAEGVDPAATMAALKTRWTAKFDLCRPERTQVSTPAILPSAYGVERPGLRGFPPEASFVWSSAGACERGYQRKPAMSASRDGVPAEIVSALLNSLTEAERQSGLAYVCSAKLQVGGPDSHALPLRVPIAGPSFVGFIDPAPTANWAHDCRYLLVRADTLEVTSYPARFPPFQSDNRSRWSLIYRAPGVGDAFLDGFTGS